MVYRFLALVARLGLGIFFRRLEVEGGERLAERGPRIFVANHPNTLIDVLLVGIFYPGKIHFLAKSGLFRNPVMAAALTYFGVIPVYRRQDASDPSENVDSFSKCYEALEAGKAICLFPEGTSATGPRLLPFKTGAARIALGAEARNGFGLGVRIVPVGLAYEEKSVFRSQVLVRVGRPVDVDGWRERYEADEREAARELTEHLEQAFADLVPQADDFSDLRSIERVRRLFQDERRRRGEADPEVVGADLATRVRLDQRFLEGYAHYKATDPVRVEALRHRVDRFYEMLDLAGMPPSAVALDVGTGRAVVWLLGGAVFLLLGLPFYVVGLAHDYVVYRAIGFLTARLRADFEYTSTVKFLLGLILFPLWHLVVAGAYAAWLGAVAFPIALVGTAACGLFTLSYWTRLRRFALGIAAFFRNRGRVRSALEKRRRQILDEIETLVAAYQVPEPTGD